MSILDEIVKAKAQRLKEAKALVSPSMMQGAVEQAAKALRAREFPFKRALAAQGLQFICELKKASPSKGVISPDYPLLEIARAYEKAGAAAISCLTEEDYFLGQAADLEAVSAAVKLPILRKDFVIDSYQIYEALKLGASAILLIVAILEQEQLCAFHQLATDLGLSVLVEAHDAAELQLALDCGAEIIGVNNRNLHDFSVDFSNSLALRAGLPSELLFVAESGVRSRADIVLLEEQGVDAVLVGETLMRSPDIAATLAELKGEQA